MFDKKSSRILFVIGILVFLSASYWFSAQSGVESNHLSSEILQNILNFLQISLPEQSIVQFHFLLRKLAHFSLYFFLGFNVAGLLRTSSLRDGKILFITLLICSAFACGDELHQLLNGTRNGCFADVLLDTCGSVSGCFILFFSVWCLSKKKKEEK